MIFLENISKKKKNKTFGYPNVFQLHLKAIYSKLQIFIGKTWKHSNKEEKRVKIYFILFLLKNICDFLNIKILHLVAYLRNFINCHLIDNMKKVFALFVAKKKSILINHCKYKSADNIVCITCYHSYIDCVLWLLSTNV